MSWDCFVLVEVVVPLLFAAFVFSPLLHVGVASSHCSSSLLFVGQRCSLRLFFSLHSTLACLLLHFFLFNLVSCRSFFADMICLLAWHGYLLSWFGRCRGCSLLNVAVVWLQRLRMVVGCCCCSQLWFVCCVSLWPLAVDDYFVGVLFVVCVGSLPVRALRVY